MSSDDEHMIKVFIIKNPKARDVSKIAFMFNFELIDVLKVFESLNIVPEKRPKHCKG